MKLKLFVVLVVAVGYMTVSFTSNAASSLCRTGSWSICAVLIDGTNPPHAVDVTGKVIPESSATQPDKPIILAKDSLDDKRGEFKPEAAFDHTKHSTDVLHSIDGKTVTACIECHHTAQPSAPAGQKYLKRFDRKEILTAEQLETSKVPVQSCRSCHFQKSSEETADFPPKSITYPKSMGKEPSGKLFNNVAYHINCNSCHDAVMARESTVKDSKIKAPADCIDCHTKKQ